MLDNREKQNRVWAAYGILLMSSLLYGLNVITGKIIAPLMPPMALAVLRGLIGLIVLLPFAWKQLRKVKPTRRDLGYMCILGLFGIALGYFTFLWGMNNSTASNASIIFSTAPAITNCLLALFWREKPSRSEVVGIVLSFLGILLVITQGSVHNILTLKIGLGDIVLLANVLTCAIYAILSQSASRKFSALVVTIYTLLSGTILLAPMGVWQLFSTNWHLDWFGWLLVLYMGTMVTGLAVFLNLEGITRIGSGKAAIFSNLMPIFAFIFSIILLGERISWYHWVGFGIALLGILLSIAKPPVQISPQLKQEAV